MKNRVLEYIQKNGSITSLEAVTELGCCDLQHYIMVLRQEHDIKDEWVNGVNRYGEATHYKRYYL